ncbi:cytochrome b561 [Arenicella chitinivorans]|uniref:Cytochrome b561 n=1 Tax=Arenicella chitinivorans TaxID=1329800 RepID=A0A918S371_9GAMM|nr:YceI family protein [Arenicella chitinivorans]GHA18539.1 cytochrome b561 [Arenicella chitinivorans]
MTTHQYRIPAKILHWLVAGLIVTQYILAKLAEAAEDRGEVLNQLAVLANHKSIGITILALALVRIVVRFTSPPPALPETMPTWQVWGSHISHLLLYGFLFALPLSGWLMSSAKAYSVSWFNLVALPDLVGPSEAWAKAMHVTHHYLAEALFIVALIHIAAALKHHLIDRDEVLRRMSSKLGWGLFIASTVLCTLVFGRIINSSAPTASDTTPAISEDAQDNAPSVRESTLTQWQVNQQNSYIKFSGDQAGAPFSGQWQQWQAELFFDADELDQSRFDVTIDPASADSNDAERDQTIASAEFFDVSNHPTARFVATEFNRQGDAFVTQGRLTMKGISKTLPFTFTVHQTGDLVRLEGQATIDRLAWNIGTGDWTDTSWVGKDVAVQVLIEATVAAEADAQ